MTRPAKIAIVGRPNVGKSALFNRLASSRIAIVDEAEGITRDRLYVQIDFFGRQCLLIDTAGLDPTSKEDPHLQEHLHKQTQFAIDEADAIIQVVDALVGPTTLDQQVSRMLLKTTKPVFLAVNKVDDIKLLQEVAQFYSLGIQEVYPLSALHGHHVADLLEKVLEKIPLDLEAKAEKKGGIKVAIVGKPNVGKSTLLNLILGEERSVVSPVAGTTRDSIDARVSWEDVDFIFIDTAGIKNKRAEHEVVEKFAKIRTLRAIERADVCLFMIDAKEGLTLQDKKITKIIEEAGKGCILFFNKWDLVKGFRMEHCKKAIIQESSFLEHCPMIFGSCQQKRNIDKIFPLLITLFEEQKRRVTTGQLNKFVERLMQKYHPPMMQGKRLRIYYMTQIGVNPPQFVLFVNNPKLMAPSYKKYMINNFRKEYGFTGCPLIFFLRGKEERKPLHALVKEEEEELILN